MRAHQVKSVFLTATKLKMERVVKECARYLVQYLDPENCIEIRSLPGIARNKTFVAQVDGYIAQQVTATPPPILASCDGEFLYFWELIEIAINEHRWSFLSLFILAFFKIHSVTIYEY